MSEKGTYGMGMLPKDSRDIVKVVEADNARFKKMSEQPTKVVDEFMGPVVPGDKGGTGEFIGDATIPNESPKENLPKTLLEKIAARLKGEKK